MYNAELLAFTSSSKEVINIYNQKSIAVITQPEIYMHKLKRFLAARKKINIKFREEHGEPLQHSKFLMFSRFTVISNIDEITKLVSGCFL